MFCTTVWYYYMTKKMLTHTPRKKNERNSQKRTKNTKLEIFSRHFAKKKLVCEKFCIHKVDHQKPKKRRKKTPLWLFFWSFLSFPHFSSSSLCFLSFFLSLRPRNKNSFFFSRAKTERERLREAFEKAFFDSFYLYECIKGRRRWKFFFNDSPHF